jgi:hypothetical protein
MGQQNKVLVLVVYFKMVKEYLQSTLLEISLDASYFVLAAIFFLVLSKERCEIHVVNTTLTKSDEPQHLKSLNASPWIIKLTGDQS